MSHNALHIIQYRIRSEHLLRRRLDLVNLFQPNTGLQLGQLLARIRPAEQFALGSRIGIAQLDPHQETVQL